MRALREPLLVLLSALTLVAAGCGGGSAEGKAEDLLGVQLPAGLDVRYYRWHPSDEISFSTTYVRLAGPRDDLLSLVRALGLSRYGTAGGRGSLPTGWQTQRGVDLDWWDASPATPPDSWAGPFGVGGRIVAKLERGQLYLIATETGLRGQTSG